MRLKIDCCWGCPDRQADPNCHGYCDTYIQQKAEYDETKAAMDEQAKLKNGLAGQSINAVGKAMHNRNLHHKTGRWR